MKYELQMYHFLQHKNMASFATYIYSLGNAAAHTSAIAVEFNKYKKNQSTNLTSSSSESLYHPPIVSSNLPFSTNLLKTRLDSTTKHNVGSTVDIAFSSTRSDNAVEFRKKCKISSLLTAKSASTLMQKNMNQNVRGNSVTSENNPTSNLTPIVPNIIQPTPFFNSLTQATSNVENKDESNLSNPLGAGDKYGPTGANNFSTTFKRSSTTSVDDDGLYSMSSVHFSSDFEKNNSSSFLRGNKTSLNERRDQFLHPSGIPTSHSNTHSSFQKPFSQSFQPYEGPNFDNTYSKGGYSNSAFQPLNITSKFNNRNGKSSARKFSCESLNNLVFGFSTNNNSDNNRGLRSKISGENIVQSTLSYHLSSKFSKRHLSQR